MQPTYKATTYQKITSVLIPEYIISNITEVTHISPSRKLRIQNMRVIKATSCEIDEYIITNNLD